MIFKNRDQQEMIDYLVHLVDEDVGEQQALLYRLWLDKMTDIVQSVLELGDEIDAKKTVAQLLGGFGGKTDQTKR